MVLKLLQIRCIMKKVICVGDAVESIAGRDKGKIYIVLNVDCDYASLANGFERKTQSPKRKNVKHIKLVKNAVLEKEVIDNLTNLNAILHHAVAKLKVN